jgi:hypothetical protein
MPICGISRGNRLLVRWTTSCSKNNGMERGPECYSAVVASYAAVLAVKIRVRPFIVTIEAQVRQAFAGSKPPAGELISTCNDEGASEALSGRSWEHVSPGQLQQHSAAVNFLAPPAFAYYLPAFMLASLSDAGVRDSLLSKLLPPKADPTRPSFAAWWQLLSGPQKAAVVAFVEHFEGTGLFLDSASVEALKRQGGPNTSFERRREG